MSGKNCTVYGIREDSSRHCIHTENGPEPLLVRGGSLFVLELLHGKAATSVSPSYFWMTSPPSGHKVIPRELTQNVLLVWYPSPWGTTFAARGLASHAPYRGAKEVLI